MARTKREYRVLLGATIAKEVRVMAYSAKDARGLLTNAPDVDQLGAIPFSEAITGERIIDVVRVDREWHNWNDFPEPADSEPTGADS